MKPKCIFLKPCKIHENGAYTHWPCGVYSREKRHIRFLNSKLPCVCGGLKAPEAKKCTNCNKKEKHWNWKGDQASYSAKHRWLQRNVKKPSICSFCKERKELVWANRSGKYKRDLKDWIVLCYKCHSKYDDNYPPIQTKEFRKKWKPKTSL